MALLLQHKHTTATIIDMRTIVPSHRITVIYFRQPKHQSHNKKSIRGAQRNTPMRSYIRPGTVRSQSTRDDEMYCRPVNFHGVINIPKEIH